MGRDVCIYKTGHMDMLEENLKFFRIIWAKGRARGFLLWTPVSSTVSCALGCCEDEQVNLSKALGTYDKGSARNVIQIMASRPEDD